MGLEPADSENRYCPRCGATRVLADPPDRADSSQLIRIGYDSFGERTREFYAHSSLTLPPLRLKPFSPLPESYLPLFPSCWTSRALHTVEDSPIYSGEHEFGAPIAKLVLGHGRFWVLFQNGGLQAYSSETLEPIRTFEKSDWRDSTEQDLFLSGHFLYGLGRRQGAWILRTIDAASGEPEPAPLPIELEQPVVEFEGLEGVALGRDSSTGRFTVQRLRATATETVAEQRHGMKASSAESQGRPWWGRHAGEEFVLCPDGSLRRWVAELERFDVEWPNESRARVDCPHSWRDELLFPVSTTSAFRLLRVNSQGVASEQELGTQEAAAATKSCVVGDSLYLLLSYYDHPNMAV